ncbi:hypothetical protein WICPIJ_009528 [Wickerhamomyces pijperi]|uniref:Uncharacterized protein n=1 Tax=Wickerhamomyces pijperi TaxID=599730 RepID=A0A9P8TDJ6_WICPI|nr:hypothetical protein WICPIJ_009528 [Wickerhamomyces pijperi]
MIWKTEGRITVGVLTPALDWCKDLKISSAYVITCLSLQLIASTMLSNSNSVGDLVDNWSVCKVWKILSVSDWRNSLNLECLVRSASFNKLLNFSKVGITAFKSSKS